MIKTFASGELEIVIREARTPLGKPCIEIEFAQVVKARIALTDAEQVADALIACIRAAETKAEKRR